MRVISKIFLTFAVFSPPPLKRAIYRKIFGYEIADNAKIGFSFIYCDKLVLGQHSRIGHFSAFRNLKSLVLEEHASIGNLNWVTHSRTFPSSDNRNRGIATDLPRGRLTLLRHSAVTNRHYLDVQAEIVIGEYSTMAGVRTTVLTHSINIFSNRQEVGSIRIGSYCFIGSNSVILSGVSICDKAVVGAGSVVCHSLADGAGVYAGSPAKMRKQLAGNEHYFNRVKGYVD